jgi:hypothetical protein
MRNLRRVKRGQEETGGCLKRRRIRCAGLRLVALLALLAVAAVAPVHASSNKAVQGNGSGSVTCTSGGPAFPATISFNANLSQGTISGFFSISGVVFKFGGVVSGSVSTTRYELRGIEQFAMCPGAATPTTFTIGRDCGLGVTINFEAANGQRGAFVGNVACQT